MFFGLFSCGGYAWWRTLYNILFLCSLLPFLAYGIWKFKTKYSKQNLLKFIFSATGILLLSMLCFEIVQAGAAQFYPSPPEGIGNLFNGFISQLFGPPC
jgi:hypothetical protein